MKFFEPNLIAMVDAGRLLRFEPFLAGFNLTLFSFSNAAECSDSGIIQLDNGWGSCWLPVIISVSILSANVPSVSFLEISGELGWMPQIKRAI